MYKTSRIAASASPVGATFNSFLRADFFADFARLLSLRKPDERHFRPFNRSLRRADLCTQTHMTAEQRRSS